MGVRMVIYANHGMRAAIRAMEQSFAAILNVHYLMAYFLGSLVVMFIGLSLAYFGQKKPLQVSAPTGGVVR